MLFVGADVRGRFRDMHLYGTAAALLIRIVFLFALSEAPVRVRCGGGYGYGSSVLSAWGAS